MHSSLLQTENARIFVTCYKPRIATVLSHTRRVDGSETSCGSKTSVCNVDGSSMRRLPAIIDASLIMVQPKCSLVSVTNVL